MKLGDLIRNLTPRKLKEIISYSKNDEYSHKVYSQEGEDLLLSRIFYHSPNGFYVDCGAHHPFRFSNTKLLYDRGWCGINIEPNPDAISMFREHRKRDIFVNTGIGLVNAKLKYHKYSHPALNTFDEVTVKNRDVQPDEIILVDIRPLSQILDDYVPINQSIDLLTIDAEGFDLQILKSNNWAKYSPAFILVEVDAESIEQLLKSDIYMFLSENDYKLTSKLWKSCLFKYAGIEK